LRIRSAPLFFAPTGAPTAQLKVSDFLWLDVRGAAVEMTCKFGTPVNFREVTILEKSHTTDL
jgi:hypothetical protein